MPYLYVLNNPTNFLDSSGNFVEELVAIITIIGAGAFLIKFGKLGDLAKEQIEKALASKKQAEEKFLEAQKSEKFKKTLKIACELAAESQSTP